MKNYYFTILLFAFISFQLAGNTSNDSTRLSLQNKNLSALPDNIDFLKLKSINLRYNNFTTLPLDITKSAELQDLDLSFNKTLNMKTFSEQVKHSTLTKLEMESCNMLYLPLEFSGLKKLEYLSLANNYLTEIPEDYSCNPKLSYLDVANNKIIKLPENFNSWTSLQYINLSNNPCLNENKTYNQLSNLPLLHTLILTKAKTLNPVIFDNAALKKIDFSDGTFSSLIIDPKSVINIEQLTATNCNSFDFNGIASLLQSPSLKELEIGGDLFTGFHDISLSSSLEKISISGKELNQFKLKNDLTNLRTLEVHFSKINCAQDFFSSTSNAPKLETLALPNMGLSILPHTLGKLKSLKVLDLSFNKLQTLNALYELKQLKKLVVSGCNLSGNQLKKLKEELPNTLIINDISPKPLLQGSEQSKENYVVDAAKNMNVLTQNGTEINIPANSLINSAGKTVSGTVSISYDTYYSLASIAASGVHMNYSDSGEVSPFVSAGMFKLTASQNGEALQLKRGKEIKMAFKSLDSTNAYNFYQYDSIRQSWTETQKDSVMKIKIAREPVIDSSAIIAASFGNTARMPNRFNFVKYHGPTFQWAQPVAKNQKRFKMSVKVGAKHKKSLRDSVLPDNYMYEINKLSEHSTWWLVDEADLVKFRADFARFFQTDIKEKNHKKYWNRSRLWDIKGVNQNNFELTVDRERDNFIFKFSTETDSLIFHAYPDLRSKDVGSNQKATKKIFDNYHIARANREKITAARMERYLRLYKLYVLEAEQYRQKILQQNRLLLKDIGNKKVDSGKMDVTRYLSLSGFGTHNCDHPLDVPQPVIFASLKLVDESGELLSSEYGTGINFIDTQNNLSISYSLVSNRVPSNTVMTVMLSKGRKTYIGKYSTLGKKGNIGSETIKVSEVSKDFTFDDFANYINSIPL